jgi:thiol-disulfide isomerase/thioredoxin
MSQQIHHVSDETFESEVLQSNVPVLVDYWAEWCGPCKMIAPILNEVAVEYDGRLKVSVSLKLDSQLANTLLILVLPYKSHHHPILPSVLHAPLKLYTNVFLLSEYPECIYLTLKIST